MLARGRTGRGIFFWPKKNGGIMLDPVSALYYQLVPETGWRKMIPPRRLGQPGISVRILRGQGGLGNGVPRG